MYQLLCSTAILFLIPLLLQAQDTYEPNNTFNDAYEITAFESYTSYIYEAFDDDYYKLNILEPGMLRVVLTSSPSNVNLRAIVYNEDSQEIQRRQGSNGDTYLFEVSTCGVGFHYLHFIDAGLGESQGNAFNTEEAYSFRVEFYPFASVDACECENETIAQACPIPFGEIQSAVIAPDFNNSNSGSRVDNDVYQLTVPEPGVIRLFTLSIPENIDLDAIIYDPNAQEIKRYESAGVGETYLFEVSVCEEGTYYLSMEDGESGLSNGWSIEDPYLFRVDFVAFSETDPCECIPNFTDSSCSIEFCKPVFGTLSATAGQSSGTQDADQYTFELEADTETNLTFSSVPADLSIDFKVKNPMGSTISQGDASTSGTFQFTSDIAGEYTLTLEPTLTFAFNSVDNYEFQLGCNLNAANSEAMQSLRVATSDGAIAVSDFSGTLRYELFLPDGRKIHQGVIGDGGMIDCRNLKGLVLLKLSDDRHRNTVIKKIVL